MKQPKRSTAWAATPDLNSSVRLRVGARVSGEHSLRYAMLRDVLVRYLSPILVDSVLSRALEARHLTPAAMNGAELAEVASDIMVGLRLFVPEQQLPSLMLALADILESP